MRFINLITFLFFLCLIFSACDPCKNLDCATDNFFGQFRIVSEADREDLLFGPGRLYDKDQLLFYSLKDTDTTFFDYQVVPFAGGDYDSILQVHFFPKSDIAYMQLSNGDVDTLSLDFQTINSRCCGRITKITSFRLNNKVSMPGRGTHEIKK
jgi:hypothetical protein